MKPSRAEETTRGDAAYAAPFVNDDAYECAAWKERTRIIEAKTPEAAALRYHRENTARRANEPAPPNTPGMTAAFARFASEGATQDIYVKGTHEDAGRMVRLHFGWTVLCPGECND